MASTASQRAPKLKDIPLACVTVMNTCGSWAIFLAFLGATIGACFGLFGGTAFYLLYLLVSEELDELSMSNILKAAYVAIKYCSTGGGLLGGAFGTVMGVVQTLIDLDEREKERKQKEEERKEKEKNGKQS